MKYEKAVKGIFSIFNSPEWDSAGLVILPENTKESPEKYGKVNVIFKNPSFRNNLAGLLIVTIFTEFDTGPIAGLSFADSLDSFLLEKSRKTDEGVLQFFQSNLKGLGKDPDNPALYRHQYTINFNYNGVF